VKHIGQTSTRGYAHVAVEHMAKVNGATAEEARALIEAAYRDWSFRSSTPWTIAVRGRSRRGPNHPHEAAAEGFEAGGGVRTR
jgi:hypothetical protein